MATFKIPEISYTSRDFRSVKDDAIRAIPFFTEEWTDHNPSDFGISIIELFAMMMDGVHYYIDRQQKETLLGSAIKRESVREHLKLIDYQLGTATPSSVDVSFSLPSALVADLLIPKGTRLQTVSSGAIEPVIFETSEDLVIPAGSLTGSVGAIEGLSSSEDLGISDGTQLQRFLISFEKIIVDSLKIFVDEGSGDEEWTKVDSFIESTDTDKHYKIDISGNPERITVEFGDNVSGKIPSPSSTIYSEFRVLSELRGDVTGNVGAGTIKVVNDTITLLGDPVSLSVTNPLSASGGEAEESIEEAKINGPRSLRALNRAVTLDDYKTLTQIFPGILLANAVLNGELKNSTDSCCCGICIFVYIDGGGPISSVLKEDLLNCLNQKKMAGTCIEVKDAVQKKINISGKVYLRDSFEQSEAELCVNQAIDNFFKIRTGPIEIGRDIRISDIYPLITNCYNEGVNYVDLETLTIQPEPSLVVWSGDTYFEFISPLKEAIEETWTIIFTSSTKFTVRGSESGLQQNIGTIGEIYTSDNNQNLTFKISPNPEIPSPLPNTTGDYALFNTTKSFDNINIPDDCIAVKGNVALSFFGGSKKNLKC